MTVPQPELSHFWPSTLATFWIHVTVLRDVRLTCFWSAQREAYFWGLRDSQLKNYTLTQKFLANETCNNLSYRWGMGGTHIYVPLGSKEGNPAFFFLLVVHTLRDFQAWLKDSIGVLKVQQPNPCTQEQLLSNSDFIGCRNIGQTINFK